MKQNSGVLLHMGINYLITPPPHIDQRQFLAFQNALLDEGIDYGEAKHTPREITLTRTMPPLQVRVIAADNRMGQLVILSPQPQDALEIFGMKAQGLAEAFTQTWGNQHRILASDCTLRYLFDSSAKHAFQEIWETYLGQNQHSLATLGTPVGGGGLRLVMPPSPVSADPVEIEIKIESYLKDPRKLFVETQFKWPQKQTSETPFDPADRLAQVDEFIEDKVMAFIQALAQP